MGRGQCPRGQDTLSLVAGHHLSESILIMFIRAFLRLFLLGDLTAGLRPAASGWSPRSSISMVMTTFELRGDSSPALAVPSLPANRYFLSLRESPRPPLPFFSLTALVLRLWSSIAYRTGACGEGAAGEAWATGQGARGLTGHSWHWGTAVTAQAAVGP